MHKRTQVIRKNYIEIRKYLENKSVDKEEIAVIMRMVGNELERGAIKKVRNSYGKEVKLVGLFLFLTGMLLTAGTYFGIITTGNTIIIAYGPVVGGLIMMVSGQYWKMTS